MLRPWGSCAEAARDGDGPAPLDHPATRTFSGLLSRMPESGRPDFGPGGSRAVRAERLGIRTTGPKLASHRLDGRNPSARPAMKVCASSVSPAFGGPTETKKARHRRCFKPPLDLLGRPQARANLGRSDVCASRPRCKSKTGTDFLVRHARGGRGLCSPIFTTIPPVKERGGPGRPFRSPPDRSSRSIPAPEGASVVRFLSQGRVQSPAQRMQEAAN